MTREKLDELRNELSIKSKNGIDFTLAASLIWLLIAYLWTLEFKAYDRSIFAGIIALGALLLGLNLSFEKMYFVALFTSVSLLILTSGLYFDTIKKLKQ